MSKMYKHPILPGVELTRAEFIEYCRTSFKNWPDVMTLIEMLDRDALATTGTGADKHGYHFAPPNIEGIAHLMDQRSMTATSRANQLNRLKRDRLDSAVEARVFAEAAGMIRQCKFDLE